jgi:hypothetical protein
MTLKTPWPKKAANPQRNLTKIMKTQKNHLAEWMLSPAMDQYLGRRACYKLAILSALLNGENLSAVARRFGTSKQAAGKHAAAARRIFGKGTG